MMVHKFLYHIWVGSETLFVATTSENGNHGPGFHTQYGQSHSVYKSEKFVVNTTAASKYIPKRVENQNHYQLKSLPPYPRYSENSYFIVF